MNRTRETSVVSPGDELASRANETHPTVLVVDDETAIADTIAKILNLKGYPAVAAYDGDCALETSLLHPPRLLITDVFLPGMNGIELASIIKRVYPECKIMLFSGQSSAEDLLASTKGAGKNFTLLRKPLPPQKLLDLVAEHLVAGPINTAVSTASISGAQFHNS